VIDRRNEILSGSESERAMAPASSFILALSPYHQAFDRQFGYAGARHPGIEGLPDGNLAQIEWVQAADRPAGRPASYLGWEDDISIFGCVGDPALPVVQALIKFDISITSHLGTPVDVSDAFKLRTGLLFWQNY